MNSILTISTPAAEHLSWINSRIPSPINFEADKREISFGLFDLYENLEQALLNTSSP